MNGIQEVSGSIPLISTIEALKTIGFQGFLLSCGTFDLPGTFLTRVLTRITEMSKKSNLFQEVGGSILLWALNVEQSSVPSIPKFLKLRLGPSDEHIMKIGDIIPVIIQELAFVIPNRRIFSIRASKNKQIEPIYIGDKFR